jgi:activator of HSP90 ATPase
MKDFKKYYKIKAEAQDIFACLTNQFTIELWTGYPAKIEAKEDTEFELWGGDISGKIIKIEPNKLLVQQWYFDEQESQSIVTIKLHELNNAVSVELSHTNIPDEVYEEFANGWNEYYFGAIKEFLEE